MAVSAGVQLNEQLLHQIASLLTEVHNPNSNQSEVRCFQPTAAIAAVPSSPPALCRCAEAAQVLPGYPINHQGRHVRIPCCSAAVGRGGAATRSCTQYAPFRHLNAGLCAAGSVQGHA